MYRATPKTRLHVADDRLSRAASAYIAAHRALEFAVDDVHAFGGPGECLAHVIDRWESELESTLADFGFYETTLLDEIAKRTTAKFAYDRFRNM